MEELGRRAGRLRIGPGSDFQTELGPLISEKHRAKVERLVGDAVDGGAVAAIGGTRPDIGLPGWFYEPTVLTGIGDDAALSHEEIFGPVVAVEPFGDERQAVLRANDSLFGLGASVWTRDRVRAARIASQLHAGTVWTNDLQYLYAAGQPLGRLQVVRVRPHALQAGAVRVHAGEVRRLGLGQGARAGGTPTVRTSSTASAGSPASCTGAVSVRGSRPRGAIAGVSSRSGSATCG